MDEIDGAQEAAARPEPDQALSGPGHPVKVIQRPQRAVEQLERRPGPECIREPPGQMAEAVMIERLGEADDRCRHGSVRQDAGEQGRGLARDGSNAAGRVPPHAPQGGIEAPSRDGSGSLIGRIRQSFDEGHDAHPGMR